MVHEDVAMKALRTVLIANRGEIAVRCIRACKKLSITSLAIFTKADAGSLHVRLAEKSVLLDDEGPQAYMDIDALLSICQKHKVDAVIPGYGFLSENSYFVRRIEEAGIIFVGPDANAIDCMGLKHTARELAIEAGVPVIDGSGLLRSPQEAVDASEKVGYPVMLKASGGGGGIGTQVCLSKDEVGPAFTNVQRTSEKLFKAQGVFLERYYPKSHHIEVQIFGNGIEVIHFGERECSIQRRRQKVVEECPSPFLGSRPDLRTELLSSAVALGKRIKYRSAGTVEFLVDDQTGKFFFLEMNTRLQVEHGITELCFGVDIVSLMLEQADVQLAGSNGIDSGHLLAFEQMVPKGVAIEVRVCCENPANQFSPGSGTIQELVWPKNEEVRVDTWIQPGSVVSSYFDSLLAKVMVHSATRDDAIRSMSTALEQSKLGGVASNLAFLRSIITSEVFAQGVTLTTFLDEQFEFAPTGILVKSPGALTMVQQARERTTKGYGIPVSGPMDDVSAIVANLVVGNPQDTECLEVLGTGPELYFYSSSAVAVCGATFSIELDGTQKDMWSSISVNPGQTLRIGQLTGRGARCYVAFKGGFPHAPFWLGSKSTTPSLDLGGIQGRQLRQGEYLELQQPDPRTNQHSTHSIPPEVLPPIGSPEIYVMHGPHDSDEFITPAGRKTIYTTSWKVDHNCSRTGIRLIGPNIEWARTDGGAGGSHPSNVVEYPYPAPGGVNWTGDNPVVLPHDSPGLGGFLCSSTIVSADLWKLGQLKAGETVKLCPISYESARDLARAKEDFLSALQEYLVDDKHQPHVFPSAVMNSMMDERSDAILQKIEGKGTGADLTLRQAADNFVLVDLGFQKASLKTTVSANLLARGIQDIAEPGLFVHINISSVMIEYNPSQFSQQDIVRLVQRAHEAFQGYDKPVKCRRLVLPIVFDHPSIEESVERYRTLQRAKAVYVPDNVEYVQRNNGLEKRASVIDILRSTRFMVVTVGFLTGLPLMLPLDPHKRITAQKYNPTRTATPPGAVGLGGPLFCIYAGSQQPGGYMLLAKTISVWDTFSLRSGFSKGRPWLCEPFDLIEFREVDTEEYASIEEAFASGTYEPDIQDAVFDVAKELALETERTESQDVQDFMARQKSAIEETRLQEDKLYHEWMAEQGENDALQEVIDEGAPGVRVMAAQTGKMWKVLVEPGQKVKKDMPLMTLESMKMEITVAAEENHDGLIVDSILKKEGSLVSNDTAVVILVGQNDGPISE